MASIRLLMQAIINETPADINDETQLTSDVGKYIEALNPLSPSPNKTRRENKAWDDAIDSLSDKDLLKLTYSFMRHKMLTATDPLIRGASYNSCASLYVTFANRVGLDIQSNTIPEQLRALHRLIYLYHERSPDHTSNKNPEEAAAREITFQIRTIRALPRSITPTDVEALAVREAINPKTVSPDFIAGIKTQAGTPSSERLVSTNVNQDTLHSQKIKFLLDLQLDVIQEKWNVLGHGLFKSNKTPDGIADLRKALAKLNTSTLASDEKIDKVFAEVQGILKKRKSKNLRENKRGEGVTTLYKTKYDECVGLLLQGKTKFLAQLQNDLVMEGGTSQWNNTEKDLIGKKTSDSVIKLRKLLSKMRESPEQISEIFDAVQKILKANQAKSCFKRPSPALAALCSGQYQNSLKLEEKGSALESKIDHS